MEIRKSLIERMKEAQRVKGLDAACIITDPITTALPTLETTPGPKHHHTIMAKKDDSACILANSIITIITTALSTLETTKQKIDDEVNDAGGCLPAHRLVPEAQHALKFEAKKKDVMKRLNERMKEAQRVKARDAACIISDPIINTALPTLETTPGPKQNNDTMMAKEDASACIPTDSIITTAPSTLETTRQKIDDEVNDAAAAQREFIGPWLAVLGAAAAEGVAVHVCGKLAVQVRRVVVNPADQRLDVLDCALGWASVLPRHHMSCLVRGELLPTWHSVLFEWLLRTGSFANADKSWKFYLFEKLGAVDGPLRTELGFGLDFMGVCLSTRRLVPEAQHALKIEAEKKGINKHIKECRREAQRVKGREAACIIADPITTTALTLETTPSPKQKNDNVLVYEAERLPAARRAPAAALERFDAALAAATVAQDEVTTLVPAVQYDAAVVSARLKAIVASGDAAVAASSAAAAAARRRVWTSAAMRWPQSALNAARNAARSLVLKATVVRRKIKKNINTAAAMLSPVVVALAVVVAALFKTILCIFVRIFVVAHGKSHRLLERTNAAAIRADKAAAAIREHLRSSPPVRKLAPPHIAPERYLFVAPARFVERPEMVALEAALKQSIRRMMRARRRMAAAALKASASEAIRASLAARSAARAASVAAVFRRSHLAASSAHRRTIAPRRNPAFDAAARRQREAKLEAKREAAEARGETKRTKAAEARTAAEELRRKKFLLAANRRASVLARGKKMAREAAAAAERKIEANAKQAADAEAKAAREAVEAEADRLVVAAVRCEAAAKQQAKAEVDRLVVAAVRREAAAKQQEKAEATKAAIAAKAAQRERLRLARAVAEAKQVADAEAAWDAAAAAKRSQTKKRSMDARFLVGHNASSLPDFRAERRAAAEAEATRRAEMARRTTSGGMVGMMVAKIEGDIRMAMPRVPWLAKQG